MNNKQFTELYEQLVRLYGPVLENNRFIIDGCRVCLTHNEDHGTSWIGVQMELMPLTEETAFDLVSTALAFNGIHLSKTRNPAWFGMTGETAPYITLNQRSYDPKFTVVDVGNFVKYLRNQAKEFAIEVGVVN